MGIKIAHVLAYPYHGGIQEYALNLAKRQSTLGNHVSIFTSGVGPENGAPNFTNVNPALTLFRNPVSLNLARQVFHNDADVIHVHIPFPISGDLVIFLNNIKNRGEKKLFITYHCDIDLESSIGKLFAYFYNNLVLKKIVNYSDGLFVSSKRFASLSPILKGYNGRIIVKPLGVDTKKFHPTPSEVSDVLFVGRIIPEKGIHYLIKSFEFLNSDIKLKVVGKAIDDRYYDYLISLQNEVGLKDRVLMMGYVSDQELCQMYHDARVVVLPSITRLESFGISLLEAMASGKPIIATDVIPGAVETIEKSGAGLVVPSRDPSALAQAINYVSGSQGIEMGKKARKYVEKYCDWDVLAEEITKEYFNAV